MLLIGGFGFEVWRRKFKKVWDDGEERIAEAIKKATDGAPELVLMGMTSTDGVMGVVPASRAVIVRP